MLKRRNFSSSRYKKVAITTIKDPDKKLAVKTKSKKCTESTHAEIIDAAQKRKREGYQSTELTSHSNYHIQSNTEHLPWQNP